MVLMEAQKTDPMHDELATQLEARLEAPEAAKAPGAYRVEEILKVSSAETTQLVYLLVSDGRELGPYVRKLIVADSGIGGAYRTLLDAQSSGKRFRQLPRIVSIADKGSVVEVLIEHVNGATLREVVRSARSADRKSLTAVLMPAVCDAVIELHEGFDVPVIHRDLTPTNVICPEADPTAPVLIDLGIAREWREGASSDTTYLGTQSYAPPEQFGFGQIDVRSDVYALGMLTFFCLAGRDPEPEDRERGFKRSAISAAWRKVIERACALDPAQRYQGVRELKVAVLSAGEEEAAKAERKAARDAARSSADGAEGPAPGSDDTTASAHAATAASRRKGKAASPDAKKPARLITPRNVIVLVPWAFLTLLTLYAPFSPDTALGIHPVFSLVGYFLWMPFAYALVAYALMDRRWLYENAPVFRDRKPVAVTMRALAAFAVLTSIWFILAGLGW